VEAELVAAPFLKVNFRGLNISVYSEVSESKSAEDSSKQLYVYNNWPLCR
jgi:hypothetical protein